MDNVKMFPMTCAQFSRGEQVITLVWADGSKRIVEVFDDAPASWLYTDSELGITRLLSAGWKEIQRGEVVL